MWQRLQPYLLEAATLCAGGCNPMCQALVEIANRKLGLERALNGDGAGHEPTRDEVARLLRCHEYRTVPMATASATYDCTPLHTLVQAPLWNG